MIIFKHKGDFSKTTRYFEQMKKSTITRVLDHFGRKGVQVLSAATPVDTGLTAASWYYEIVHTKTGVSLNFGNSNVQNGVPIAIILQYGHGTRNGGWVQGRDYINPAIQPVFDELTKRAWEEVTKV